MSKQLTKIVQLAQSLGVPREALVFTPTLARGLDYYTGMIFEVSLPNYDAGSCGGGGRYDQLIEQLGGIKMPAVGMAFGFARTVAAAQNLELIPDCSASAQILVTVFSTETLPYSLSLAQQLRQAGYQVEVYSSTEDSLGKQLKLADQKQIPWAIIAGPDEVEAEQVTLKNMTSGEQQVVPLAELPNELTLEEVAQEK
jgi:histidyl-tRNA synthetase